LLAKRDDVIRELYCRPEGISHEVIRTAQEDRWSKGVRSVGIPASQILRRAKAEARKLEHPIVGPEHLLLALLSYSTPDSDFLEQCGLTDAKVREHVEKDISWMVMNLGHGKFYKHAARNVKN